MRPCIRRITITCTSLHPAQTDALYFVARGDGTSEFSSTLAEHTEAVRRYQLKANGSAR